MRVRVTYVRSRVRVCARTCARMQPRKAFLFRDERRRRCRVSDKHEQHACLRKISGMSLHTHCNAVMQSFEPRRVDDGRTWRRIARALLVAVNYYLRRYAVKNGVEKECEDKK